MGSRHPLSGKQQSSNMHLWVGAIVLLLLALTIRWARNPSSLVVPQGYPPSAGVSGTAGFPQTAATPYPSAGAFSIPPAPTPVTKGFVPQPIVSQPPAAFPPVSQPAVSQVPPIPIVSAGPPAQPPAVAPVAQPPVVPASSTRILPPIWKMAALTPPVNALLVDPTGTAWAALNGGLAQIVGDKVTILSRANGFFPGQTATCLAYDGRNLWIGTYEGLFQTTDGRNFRRYQKADGLAHDMVWSLDWDGKILWIGTQEGFSFMTPEGRLEKVDKKISNGGLADLWVGSIKRLDRWAFCGNDDGLSVWNTALMAANPAAWVTMDMFTSNLAHNWILSMGIAEGRLWAGTPSGLCRLETPIDNLFSGARVIWRVFTRSDGLPNERIDALTAAGNDLWIGTPEGLARMRGGSIRSWRYVDGLLASDVRAVAASADTLWVGTSVGVQALDLTKAN